MFSNQNLKSAIRHIPDFPKPGILFIDITTLLANPGLNKKMYDEMSKPFIDSKIDVVVAGEARGFIFGTPIAERLGVSFAPIRKKGKLPYRTIVETYMKEYGPDELHMHEDAIKKGQKILIVDDLLATGGTTEAMIKLVEKAGGVVAGIVFAIELGYLKGRDKMKNYKVHSVINYKTSEEQQ